MITKAGTVDEWFEKIDGERATPLSTIRKIILRATTKVEKAVGLSRSNDTPTKSRSKSRRRP